MRCLSKPFSVLLQKIPDLLEKGDVGRLGRWNRGCGLLLGLLLRLRLVHLVERLDDAEEHQGDQQELDDGVDEVADVERDPAGTG